MPERVLLTATAVILAIVGAAALFAPDELAVGLAQQSGTAMRFVLQALGGALLGFAMMNWMLRRQRVGGIYGRPLALGNLVLFACSALSIAKAQAPGDLAFPALALCGLLAALASCFAWLIFMHSPTGDR